MKSFTRDESNCQLNLEIFGYDIEFDINLNKLLKKLHDGIEKDLSRKQWNKDKNGMFELIKAYLEFRTNIANEAKDDLKASKCFINFMTMYCLYSTYFDNTNGLFKLEGSNITFVKSKKSSNKYGYQQQIPIDKLNDEQLKGIICVY